MHYQICGVKDIAAVRSMFCTEAAKHNLEFDVVENAPMRDMIEKLRGTKSNQEEDEDVDHICVEFFDLTEAQAPTPKCTLYKRIGRFGLPVPFPREVLVRYLGLPLKLIDWKNHVFPKRVETEHAYKWRHDLEHFS